MLYQFHELTRSILAPISAFTNIGSQLFSNPYSPYAYIPNSKQISAGLELIHRLGKDYEKPKWDINSVTIEDREVAVHTEIAQSKPFCNLVHFVRDLEPNAPVCPKVLIVAPLSGHHATLLRDTVRTMLSAYDVYVTDWIDARMVSLAEGTFHLDDYIEYIQEFIRTLGPDLHVMSVCQPTVPVLAAISLMAGNNETVMPKSMIMMGGPLDTRYSPTEVNGLASTKPYSWFENQLIHIVPSRYPGVGRKVYPGFLQHAGFVSMNPDKHMQSHYDYYLNLMKGNEMEANSHRKFYDEYNAVLDMPAEYYLDTIRVVFQEHLLPRGLWDVRGVRVDPDHIRNVKLMTVEGELDDITGHGQTRVAHELCGNIPNANKYHLKAAGCGHYGIFSGTKWRTRIFPEVKEFINNADRD
ncbi:MAG: polyhydroxyalkanoate depolymerase [Alcaligenaceae bacterium]|nr:polyhydroxyalkanoate depolymerase [Alcaligenaceae bacterium]